MSNATASTAKTVDPKDTMHQVAQQVTQATQACCQGATDAFRAYADANQKLFATITKAWSAPFTGTTWPMPTWAAMWEKSDQAACPCNPFDAMVKLMNGMVDANARFANECNALTIDAVRTNARTIERMGTMMNEMVAAQAARTTGGTPAKGGKPIADTAREIVDEAATFLAKTSERMMKMNTEHVQSVAKLMDEVVVRPLGGTKTCCNG